MALSSDLISQLVKVNKEPKKTTESTSYGTTVTYEGKTYVKLDGSEILTPVSTTSSVKDGDRVTVLIKNHSATVSGNMSDPSASSAVVKEQADQISEFEIIIAYKVKTDELEAITAIIENLRVTVGSFTNISAEELAAINANIENIRAGIIDTDRLTATDVYAINAQIEALEAKIASIDSLEAVEADIGKLKAYTAEFTYVSAEVLEAVKADIKHLTVDKLSAKDADIKYATIENLDAASADIKKLDANVANIDTLMFGSASGSTLQTSFANAVIAQLGNAQIKSAMIDSIDAEKITVGDIISNNVRVVSEDGKLVISDETIQINDENRVRVQIGKDGAGDYSINIWDADGNLMFSEGGITDNAIKNAIIRNDMVSDNANIAASKLDIASLFSEINNSTQTIKSTKILLDENNQTLDVAFTQMSSDVNELSNEVTSQGTALSVVQGQITNKIWLEDIDEIITGDISGDIYNRIYELNTQYSELDQQLDEISATVSSHTTTIDGMTEEVIEVKDNVAQLELDLDGFRATVSDTYATKTEVDDISEDVVEVKQKAAQLELGLDGFRTTVSETYVTKNDFEDLEIGGRNLIRNSVNLIYTDYYFDDGRHSSATVGQAVAGRAVVGKG